MTAKEYDKEYRRTKDGMIATMYSSQKCNSKRRCHKKPTYSKRELRDWLYSQKLFHELYNEWVRVDYNKLYKPSVDRIVDSVGYHFGNIQLMTWEENKAKGHADMRSGKIINSSKPQRSIRQFTKQGIFIEEFISSSEASRITGVHQSNISKCCLDKRESAGGYTWEYSTI